MPHTQRPDSARDAIELMTAWLDSSEGCPDPLVNCLRSHLGGRPGGLSSAAEMIMGLTYFCGSLLVLREYETGISPQETVQRFGLEFAEN